MQVERLIGSKGCSGEFSVSDGGCRWLAEVSVRERFQLVRQKVYGPGREDEPSVFEAVKSFIDSEGGPERDDHLPICDEWLDGLRGSGSFSSWWASGWFVMGLVSGLRLEVSCADGVEIELNKGSESFRFSVRMMSRGDFRLLCRLLGIDLGSSGSSA